MKLRKSIILVLILCNFSFFACTQKNTNESPSSPVSREMEKNYKKIEVFELQNPATKIIFSKSATVEAKQEVEVTPQTNGRIIKILVKNGDSVRKGQILAIIGETINTEILELQYQAAEETFNNLQKSLAYNENNIYLNIQSAQNSLITARNATQQAIANLRNFDDQFSIQYENAEIALENSQTSYDQNRNNREDLLDRLDDLEDQIVDLEREIRRTERENPNYNSLKNQLKQLETNRESLETQVDNSKFAIEVSKNSIDQAENALTLAEYNYQNQRQQLNLAVQNNQTQYQNALIQFQSLINNSELQKINLSQQNSQALTNLKIAELNKKETQIKAPITGKIHSINVKEGVLVNPSQSITTMINDDQLIIKTGLNQNEAPLVQIGDQVQINYSNSIDSTISGRIISKAPSPNSLNKKIELEISIDEKEKDKITPQSFVKINFTPDFKGKIYIPLNSVYNEGSEKWILIAEAGKAKKLKIKTGKVIGSFIEVLSGLKGTEKIIKSSNIFIQEGDFISENKSI